MQIRNGFVFFPDDFRKAQYNISPFRGAEDVKIQRTIFSNLVDRQTAISTDKLKEQFGANFLFTFDGKDAICKALETYNLSKDDYIWIVTTSGNKYISSCVTAQIDKFCKWSRERNERTKLIFVVHEFGSVYKNMSALVKHNLPIIEDCAMSMFSNDPAGKIGSYGDFAIYSLPKFFSLQFGGILRRNKSDDKEELFKCKSLPCDTKHMLRKITTDHLTQKHAIISKRQANYDYLKEQFRLLGCEVALKLNDYECPSVFMFYDYQVDLHKLKEIFQSHGIESSVFYGQKAFFIPVHQHLEIQDLDFMVELYKYFKNEFQ